MISKKLIKFLSDLRWKHNRDFHLVLNSHGAGVIKSASAARPLIVFESIAELTAHVNDSEYAELLTELAGARDRVNVLESVRMKKLYTKPADENS